MMTSNSSTFLFVSQGPGEAGQARALARYIHGKGGKIIFALQQKVNLSFVEGDKDAFEICLTPTPQDLYNLIKTKKPTVLLLFNSKIWGRDEYFTKTPFAERPLTICIDSNWLFNPERYPFFPFVNWADYYLINIPREIFEQGLQENGGGFVIDQTFRRKVKPVGLIPSYTKISDQERESVRQHYGIQSHDKLIFTYLSGYGADHRPWVLENLINAFQKIKEQRTENIKIIYVGPTEILDSKLLKTEGLTSVGQLSADEYYRLLASSDLVFQHQGMGTLAQAISANIPVIANVGIPAHDKFPKIHYWEVYPFMKKGVCEMLTNTTPIINIQESIEKLLFNQTARQTMQKNQIHFSKEGELKAYSIIQEALLQQKKF